MTVNICIDTALQPKPGWNYATVFRLVSGDQRFQADASVFYYRMNQAIVRRVGEGGNESFVNAGGTNQLGVETMISGQLMAYTDHGFIRGLRLANSHTFSRFRLREYRRGGPDYSGTDLTGLLRNPVVTTPLIRFTH